MRGRSPAAPSSSSQLPSPSSHLSSAVQIDPSLGPDYPSMLARLAVHADVAQLVEHPICNRAVASSNLAVSSRAVRPAEDGARARGRVGYPSGQREQTVNLPAYAFEGSNPSPTIGRQISDGRWEMGDGRWEMGDGRWEMGDVRGTSAGVAQLVERKPSKFDVAGSSPVSRSIRAEVRGER